MNMRVLAFRSVRANPVRFVATVLAVLVGTSFLAGTLVLKDSLGTALAANVNQQLAGVDAAVQGKESGAAGEASSGPRGARPPASAAPGDTAPPATTAPAGGRSSSGGFGGGPSDAGPSTVPASLLATGEGRARGR